MSAEFLQAWADADRDARFGEPTACAARATAFERTVRRRNIAEYLAAAIVAVAFSGGAVATAMAGDWALAGACALIVAGVLSLVHWLATRGTVIALAPELSCASHWRAQLVRQRDLLRAVPLRYIGPLVPGLLSFYAAVTYDVAQYRGWTHAIAGAWLPLAGTLGLLILVVWLNLAAARQLGREIAALDQLAER